MSIIEDKADTVLGRRVRSEREGRGWSLAELAGRAGVSKAMLSKIERAEASPTAATLSRIATAYGLTMAALFEVAAGEGARLQRAKDQPVWRDPKAAYLRRQVFLHPANPLELVEIELPAKQEAGFPASAYHLIRQVVWVIDGRLVLMEGAVRHELAAGDRVELGPPSDIVFRNESAQPCRYLVAIVRR
ncbi:helix-turn-helix transcriptional regulator [Bradyrhizobium sp. CCBAU 51753]|uniref:helix-turn-helix domain-containing protein n=1 Tax=Bradyrhizobium sp. CCBAU 51753 TaxID=1325100 RepID=UPI00188BE647|nr:helix-turn-helix transcriptional regulator [Bradyrhizobium sp. CCBAU 51753]QOZ28875.1 LacI family transcriptional regulator [Bradyrhizobium sp. CCBAU 51753]